ncbi:MAG: glycosyltransferase [Anaerolineae bacterium]|nr:glycosyltransferase [Anaerolineae bacterium]
MKATPLDQADGSRQDYRQARVARWDAIARQMDTWTGWGTHYHRRLAEIYRFLVPPGQRVLELGCARGDLLAALEPAVGVGVDFSPEMIERASQRHPGLRFIHADAHDLRLDEAFDVIILSDLVNDLWDVQTVLEQVARVATPRARVIVNTYSRLWEPLLALAEKLGLGKPTLYQNWLAVEDVANLLNLAGFEVIRHWEEILCPLPVPLLAAFVNRWLVKLWPFKLLALTNFVVARPKPQPRSQGGEPSVSIVIPARNEVGNVPQIFERTPHLGSRTELVFVEGHSKDDTYAAIERAVAAHPERPCKLLRQTGVGKGDAVRLGFANASGDILMVLDADLTMPPENLPRFYEALRSGQAEFVNGVRLLYPMEDEAMRFLNLVGNKFFSLAFSWLLGQPIKDSLCGTKALWKSDYDLIAANRAYFGDFDPFGDFDLLFGAARLNLKIVDLPIRYRKRTYGTTNIHRWQHGWLLLKMVLFAAGRIKFV